MVSKNQLKFDHNRLTISSMLKGNRITRKTLVTNKPSGGFQRSIPVFPLHASECRYPQKVKGSK